MTADFLDDRAAEEEGSGRRLIGEIELRERELVNLRTHRDEAFRRAAEMRTAANILRDVGLRSETTPSGPFVALDYVPKRPESDEAWAWECASCDRPVPVMGMCETCGVFGVMRLRDPK